jgi:nitrogen fixation NifU-like protein
MSAISELYQQVILDHNRAPRNYRAMPDATRAVEGYNPLCGDHYTIFVKVQEGVIREISFQGAGCAISKASASVMSSELKGKTVEEAERIFAVFHDLVTGKLDPATKVEEMGRLAAFAGVSEFPARVKCASLPWHTMHTALTTDQKSVSTE